MSSSSSFASFFQKFSATRMYVNWIAPGNNGDRLISLGLQHVLDQTSVDQVDSEDDAEVLLLRGSGSLNDVYPDAVAHLINWRQSHPRLPLIVAPSTFYLQSGTRFFQFLEASDAPVWLFARDRTSYVLLSGRPLPQHVHVNISRDCALELVGSPALESWLSLRADEHRLIALRKDKEGEVPSLGRIHGRWLPRIIRTPLFKLRDRIVANRLSDCWAQSGMSEGRLEIVRDVSVSVSFEEFISAIARSNSILTNRLHVAILGYMLGKRTTLREGSYHKNRSVYEYSLSDEASTVTFMPRS